MLIKRGNTINHCHNELLSQCHNDVLFELIILKRRLFFKILKTIFLISNHAITQSHNRTSRTFKVVILHNMSHTTSMLHLLQMQQVYI
jgi:hypothetical protein